MANIPVFGCKDYNKIWRIHRGHHSLSIENGQ
jgi:hypothetical protein